MKFIIPLCVLVGVALAIEDQVIKAKWSAFKAEHGKSYEAAAEAKRLQTYLETSLFIEEHNARFFRGEVGYRLGHNQLSDMSAQEVRSKKLGKKKVSLEGRNFTETPRSVMPSLPTQFDWRTQGVVTPAKDQDQCGSCYAFGTVGVVESAIAQKTKNKLDLAEQQVVDCSYHVQGGMNGGCDGGHEVVVMDFVSKNGLVEESKYPYTSGTSEQHGTCKIRTGGPNGKGLKYRRVLPNDEEKLAEALVQFGPHVISISGENRDFQMFQGGEIYDNPSCPQDVDHVISLVGYGTEGGRDYWIVKNSWGTRWGENGFGKVLRGVNQCGIVSDNSWSIYF